MSAIRVMVVEDDLRTAALHGEHVGRIEGFELAAVVHSVQQALRELERDPRIDLILLDFDLPDGHGLAIVRALRAAGHRSEVIAVTAAREVDEVQTALSHGVVSYVVKPFTFRMLRDRLQQYRDYRDQLSESSTVEQSEVDRLFGLLRPPPTELPKGMSVETLRAVQQALRRFPEGCSATEVALIVGANRVTARRYLEHLADSGVVTRAVLYGGRGRPTLQYRLK